MVRDEVFAAAGRPRWRGIANTHIDKFAQAGGLSGPTTMLAILLRGLRQLDLTATYAIDRGEVLACAGAAVASAVALAFVLPAASALAGGYLLFSMLLVTIIDGRQFVIPNILSLPAIPIGLAAALTGMPGLARDILMDHGAAALAASGSLYGVREIYRRLRGVEGLGLGDVKLAAAAGAWVGLDALPMTSLLATGAALVTVLIGSRKPTESGMMTAIPFGSFIAPATAVMWLLGVLIV